MATSTRSSITGLSLSSEILALWWSGWRGLSKTDLVCGLTLLQHQRSLVLRREATQLNSIIERIRELSGAQGTKQIRVGDPRGNGRAARLIEFGGVKDEASKTKYKGRAHDLKCFDELSEFTESQFTFISAWNRSPDPQQRCRVVATSNPPDNEAGRWIINYWAPWLDKKHPNPAASGEVRYFLGKDEVSSPEPVEGKQGRLIYPESRCFISASVEDNPYLLATGYDQVLENLPLELRNKLRYGDFGGSIQDDPYQVIPTQWIEAAQVRWNPHTAAPQDAIAGDIARGGKDQTVIAARHAEQIFLWNFAGSATPDGQIAASLILNHRKGNSVIFVDVIGVGAAVVDILRLQGTAVTPFNGAEKSFFRDRSGQLSFANKRAESYWRLRELLDPAYGATLALPPGPQVLSDLTAPRWKLTLQGILLESKDEIRKRLGRSPDMGDAIAMVCNLGMTYTGAF